MKHILKRNSFLIKESKKTEQESIVILTKNNVENPEEILNKFKEGDKSKNQINLPIMSFIYAVLKYTDIDKIINTLNDYTDLLERKRIDPIKIEKGKLFIGTNEYKSFLNLQEAIDGKKTALGISTQPEDIEEVDINYDPIWEGNKISIYEAPDMDTCVAFTRGGLTGKNYGFCIGEPEGSKNMFQSYRDTQGSTFYFIVDKNHYKYNGDKVDLSDPLHIVVYDNTDNQGILLTDALNTTGNITEFGGDVDKYHEYLHSMGVPYEKLLVNKPKTPEEIKEQELLGKKNDNFEWFKNLSTEYKFKYIGRGHVLTDEQFDLINNF